MSSLNPNEFIRPLAIADIPAVKIVLADAFGGPPWHEKLDAKELDVRFSTFLSMSGFAGLVYDDGSQILGAIWWDRPSAEDLRRERGEDLAAFASELKCPFVWERDIIVAQNAQNRRIGQQLRSAFLQKMSSQGSVALTRMRDDNVRVLAIAEKLGFRRTGIRKPSSADPENIFHEYWIWSGQ